MQNNAMKKLLSFFVYLLSVFAVSAQGLPAERLLDYLTIDPLKIDKQLDNRKFFFKGKAYSGDTTVKTYLYDADPKRKNKAADTANSKNIDTVKRMLLRNDWKQGSSLTYQTSSAAELELLKNELKKQGFYCNRNENEIDSTALLFQHSSITALVFLKDSDSTKYYSIKFFKQKFPVPEDIYFGEDLLAFSSHEYLVSFFGEKNVTKDIYYFTGNELASCSVLFPNSKRQAVFIWHDQLNKTGISNIFFGGQQRLKSMIDYDKVIAENDWVLKSGIRPGMSIYQLRMLNKNDFNFYAGNSPNSGAVLTQKTGELDFKKEGIILGCVNCNDDRYESAKTMSADDAISNEIIMFVLTVVLNPDENSN
jgi:hypothetical protein